MHVCGIVESSHAGLLIQRVNCTRAEDGFVTEEYRLTDGLMIYRHIHGIGLKPVWINRHEQQVDEPKIWTLAMFYREFGEESCDLHKTLDWWLYGTI